MNGKKKICGGWWTTEKLKNGVELPAVVHVKCQAPNMALYINNLNNRKGQGK